MSVFALPTWRAQLTSIRASAQVFEDPGSAALLERVKMVGPTDANVLVIGETGTGKELIARHIHALSGRRDAPFMAVNCGAFSESLIESELFGHEKGAFTGAFTAKAGWFEAADGGTLFLDEIGDLPLNLQVKLLRVLQEREVVRLGARKPVPIDVRIVAATNVGLEAAVSAGRFREDLFYRLRVVHLTIPPLRDRPGDIIPLARYFIEEYRHRMGFEATELHEGAAQRLLAHRWPGNIRELENSIHHALIISRGHVIRAEDLQLSSLPQPEPSGPAWSATAADGAAEAALERALVGLFEQDGGRVYERVEEALLRAAYRHCHRNQVQTAHLLGLSRNIVRARLAKIGLLPGGRRGGGHAAGTEPARAVQT
ncbi:sigma 54-interacting transcriptional regulator [Ideonella sp. DXS29W]|uniref:Sigma 54-interacting transcriptional regulator n=1 Tax=Ideonella lacteola TaxID=2984193 RepID=A0ABU9BS78_9BURK